MKNFAIFLLILIIVSVGTYFSLNSLLKRFEYEPTNIENPIDDPIIEPEKKTDEELFTECMNEKQPIFERSLNLKINELKKVFSDYDVSILYNNLLDDYQITYNEKGNYYSASTVKPAAALYYYQMAADGLIDLDEKVSFSQKYWNESIRKRIELNSMVSLRKLINYSLDYSDNGAHKLLVEKAGYKALNDFVNEKIGTENTFFPNSNYGHINAVDGNALIKEVNKFILENGELGNELQSFMLNPNIRALRLDNIAIAQKYGWWKKVFHVIGIVYAEQPYTITVLTNHGENDAYYGVIKRINNELFEFHTEYMEEKTSFCKTKEYS